DHLQPSDRVAVVGIGPGAAATPFTNDRARLKRALTQMTGLYRAPAIHLHNISLSEALEILGGNDNTMALVAERECTQPTVVAAPTARGGVASRGLSNDPEFESCRFEVEQEARDIARETTVDGRQTIGALRGLLSALR